MKNKVNPNDAPKGYIAIPMPESAKDNCKGCAFDGFSTCGSNLRCAAQERKDKSAVIFVKKPKDNE